MRMSHVVCVCRISCITSIWRGREIRVRCDIPARSGVPIRHIVPVKSTVHNRLGWKRVLQVRRSIQLRIAGEIPPPFTLRRLWWKM